MAAPGCRRFPTRWEQVRRTRKAGGPQAPRMQRTGKGNSRPFHLQTARLSNNKKKREKRAIVHRERCGNGKRGGGRSRQRSINASFKTLRYPKNGWGEKGRKDPKDGVTARGAQPRRGFVSNSEPLTIRRGKGNQRQGRMGGETTCDSTQKCSGARKGSEVATGGRTRVGPKGPKNGGAPRWT